MSVHTVLNLAGFAVVLLVALPLASADDEIKAQILKLFPQADTNTDGVISDAEEAAVSREALKRHPQADKDGDGVLSDSEKKALLRQVRKRAGKTNPKRMPRSSATSPTTPYMDHCELTNDL